MVRFKEFLEEGIKKHRGGRKTKWTSKRQIELSNPHSKANQKEDDVRSVLRGTMTHDEFEKKWNKK